MTLLQAVSATATTIEKGADFMQFIYPSVASLLTLGAGWLIGRRKENADLSRGAAEEWVKLYAEMRKEVTELRTKIAELEKSRTDTSRPKANCNRKRLTR